MTQKATLSTHELLLAEGLLSRTAVASTKLMNDGEYTPNVLELAATTVAMALALIPKQDAVCKVVMTNMVTVMANLDTSNLVRQEYANQNKRLTEDNSKLMAEIKRLNELLEPSPKNEEFQVEHDSDPRNEVDQ
ncbi:hypothetical protein [Vibrio alginolyticus]|uniref:hypothetical protein n=1 Tax=Vibrio alginolyticus TaxID=663 RepID=UPI002FF0BC3C|nr:hypothetical protein [Vibrio parahaemolyticus]